MTAAAETPAPFDADTHVCPDPWDGEPVVPPSPDRLKLQDDIAAKLGALGDTPEDISTRLAGLGVTGKRMEPTCCPLANYLKANVALPPSTDVCVDGINVDVVEVGVPFQTDLARVRLPQHAQQFLDEFDAGGHEHLNSGEGE